MSLELTTRSATMPLTVAEAKAQSRILQSAEDTLVEHYIAAATQAVEKMTDLSLVESTWTYYCEYFPHYLPKWPVKSVTSIRYHADNGSTWTTVDADDYRLSKSYARRARVEPVESWPAAYWYRSDAVEVVFVTGFATGTLPPTARQAVAMLAAAYYEYREGEIPHDVHYAVGRLCSLARSY